MGFMVLDPNNDRGHQTDAASEKGKEYQAVRIFGKDSRFRVEPRGDIEIKGKGPMPTYLVDDDYSAT
jgi:hypothetical protein